MVSCELDAFAANGLKMTNAFSSWISSLVLPHVTELPLKICSLCEYVTFFTRVLQSQNKFPLVDTSLIFSKKSSGG